MPAEAKSMRKAYLATKTHYLENLDSELNKRNVRQADRALFVEGLRKAGLPVPGYVLINETKPEPY